MYGAAKWVGLFFLGLVLTALIQPHLVALLDSLGWFEPNVSAVNARNWMEFLIGSTAFPWVAGTIIGFCAGVWLDWALRSRARRHPSKRQQLNRLGERSIRISNNLLERSENSDHRNTFDAFTKPDVKSLRLDLEKRGFEFPERPKNLPERHANLLLIYWLREVGTLLRDGHFKEAKREAAKGIFPTK